MNSRSMAGWIGFAGILLLVVGSIDFMQGLIALFEDEYFVVTQSGYLVVDLTAWGWIMLIWGVLLVLAGLGLLSAQGWARWFAIVLVCVNFIAQLGSPLRSVHLPSTKRHAPSPPGLAPPDGDHASTPRGSRSACGGVAPAGEIS